MAAIAPTPDGTACCMASARNRTSGSASWKASAPEATSAVYSPRLCPASTDGISAAGSTPRPPDGDAGRQHDRLRVHRLVELGVSAVGYQLPQILAEHVGRLVEGAVHVGMAVEPGHHADRLRTLPRENKSECHGNPEVMERAA